MAITQRTRNIVTVAAGALLCAAPVFAQNSGSAGVTAADKHFVVTAMQGNMAEIQMGQMAQQKGTDEKVKQFGQRMVDDHTKLNDDMKQVAAEIGVTPPADISAKQKADAKRLDGLSGAVFDKAYAKAMVADHDKDLAEMKKEASIGHDPVKSAAAKGADVIAEHDKMAKEMNQAVNGSKM